MGAVAATVAGGVGAGCATFEDPSIVLDLRMIAMTADVPEQLVDLDPKQPPMRTEELIEQLAPTRVCAYVADPESARRLRWEMTACLLDLDLRCDPAEPQVFLGAGLMEDPDTTPDGGQACSRLEYDEDPAAWLALFTRALERDPTKGLGGLDYAVEVRVGGEQSPPELDLFGAKQVRISPRLPADRQPNHNPTLKELQIVNGGVQTKAPSRRCALRLDNPLPSDVIRVRAGQTVTLFPDEPKTGDPLPREEIIVPTIDGGFEKYTEVLTYQWLGIDGKFLDPITGGPPDVFGNQTLLGTDWIAPKVTQTTEISVWLIQRDERFGVSVYETCIRVVP
jgi:hypothetical protein